MGGAGGTKPVRGSPVMPRSGRRGRLALPCGSPYRELGPGRHAGCFGTGASERERKNRERGDGRPRRDVLHPMRSSAPAETAGAKAHPKRTGGHCQITNLPKVAEGARLQYIIPAFAAWKARRE